MLNRIFKTIFILTLCLGITLPANAGTVEVSDGSAFITKSELNYQLNNLSRRMSELENSLDSRIDKLVSSYLTRNGIWNGIRQTLNTSQLSVTGNNLVSALGQKGKYYSIPKNTTNTSGFIGNYTLLNEANKTGMASVYIKCSGYAHATKYGQHNGYNNVGTGNIYVTFNVGSDVKFTASIGRLDSSAYHPSGNGNGGDYLIYATTDLTTLAQFFVNKGDKLMWDIYSYFNSNGVPTNNWGASGTTTIRIQSVDIY